MLPEHAEALLEEDERVGDREEDGRIEDVLVMFAEAVATKVQKRDIAETTFIVPEPCSN